MKRLVKVKNVNIGGGADISVQSMTNTPTSDVGATLSQIDNLYKAGCDLVRVSVPDEASALAIAQIVKESPIPVIGDFHFSIKLAIMCAKYGIHKVRINPANIGDKSNLRDLIKVCNEHQTPIRIGVNSGSIHPEYKHLPFAEALANSAHDYEKLFLDEGFTALVLSVKSSNVLTMIDAYRMLDKMSDSPLHLGVTEAGTYENGIIKSALGIGTLLSNGIGDTIRVSLTTDDLCDEVRVGKKILHNLGLKKKMVDVVCCPTCARTCIDVKKLADLVEKATANIERDMKIAVMGCVVNGIGESEDADLGIAGGREKSVIISKGKILETTDNDKIVDCFMAHLNKIITNNAVN
ncbi:MAG TPA: flavodoxin-dependent (E)-4-hydroxy-3-methylbut-2-enyl-diphosphate synthase [Clostridia bacterium]|nr:flavodoxin-dependent (E)-4-hydroxy-3-methylbut-2-enyl-diphosphate synthase [Clostridia bacterium]